jgi:hypothetical protein
MLILAFLVGLDSSERIAYAIGGLITIALAYSFALLLFKWLGGEYDPPTAKGYRRRP